MNVHTALLDVLRVVKTVAPIMLTSLVISNLIVSLPQFRLVLKPIERLTRFANLKSGVAISSYLIHPMVGTSMLSQMYKNGMITFRETAIAIVISTLPRSIRIMILFLAPITISILGFELGLKILALDLISKVLIVSVGVLLGKRFLTDGEIGQTRYECRGFRLRDSLKVFAKTMIVMSISTFLVSLLLSSNPLSGIDFIPKEQFLIIVSGFASTTAGISVAGSLLAKGVIDEKSVLTAIYISRFFHVFVEVLRMSLPVYTSFFGFKKGIKLLSIHMACRCSSMLIALFLISIL